VSPAGPPGAARRSGANANPARSSGTIAGSAGPASSGRQAPSGIRPTSCPDSADPAEEPALNPVLTQFPARLRAVAAAISPAVTKSPTAGAAATVITPAISGPAT
jgi:hypothetical protein